MRRARRRPRGGRGGAEPRLVIRQRERLVLAGIERGHTQAELAKTLGVSQPAISKIVRRIEERLAEEVAASARRLRTRQTLRLEYLFRESMTAWDASKAETLQRRQRKTEGAAGPGQTVAELVSENRYGDPRFLETARRLLEDLRAVWGLNAPGRLEVTGVADLSPAALQAELAGQEAAYHRIRQTETLSISTPHKEQRDDHHPSTKS